MSTIPQGGQKVTKGYKIFKKRYLKSLVFFKCFSLKSIDNRKKLVYHTTRIRNYERVDLRSTLIL